MKLTVNNIRLTKSTEFEPYSKEIVEIIKLAINYIKNV